MARLSQLVSSDTVQWATPTNGPPPYKTAVSDAQFRIQLYEAAFKYGGGPLVGVARWTVSELISFLVFNASQVLQEVYPHQFSYRTASAVAQALRNFRLQLFEATTRDYPILQNITQRPADRERDRVIKPGHIFVYNERSSRIRRRTDGLHLTLFRAVSSFTVGCRLRLRLNVVGAATKPENGESDAGISQPWHCLALRLGAQSQGSWNPRHWVYRAVVFSFNVKKKEVVFVSFVHQVMSPA